MASPTASAAPLAVLHRELELGAGMVVDGNTGKPGVADVEDGCFFRRDGLVRESRVLSVLVMRANTDGHEFRSFVPDGHGAADGVARANGNGARRKSGVRVDDGAGVMWRRINEMRIPVVWRVREPGLRPRD